MKHKLPVLLLLGLSSALTTLQAQWVSQSIALNPGWNAVYLEVQPEPRETAVCLGQLPVESVWMWNRSSSTVQYVKDPSELRPENPDWLVSFPTGSPLAARSTLFSLVGGRCYLVKLPASASSLTWTLVGRPVAPPADWAPDSYNLVGYPLNLSKPPTFAAFFQSSAAHLGQPVFRLGGEGRWEKVENPSATAMRSGEAFWIGTRGASSFAGPAQVVLPIRTGVEFGRSLVESEIRIRNSSVASNAFTLTQRASLQAPASAAALAGSVPLNYWVFDQAKNQAGWFPFATLQSPAIAPGAEWVVRLEAKRPAPAGPGDATYASLIDVSDASGLIRLAVPVAATVSGTKAVRALHRAQGGGAGYAKAGLWVGAAVIDKVSEPSSKSEPNTPTPAAGEFQIRLIIHVDELGVSRLLQKVLVMWKPGTTVTNADGREEVAEPGRYVLITNDRLAANYSGATLRDGVPVARRFSSAAFGMRTNVVLEGAFAETLQGTVSLGYDDPVNPFKHKYHPDHDNWDENTPPNKLPAGKESFDVTRSLVFTFTDKDPQSLVLAGWGQTQVGGLYQETLAGLHKQPITVSGTFRLQLASNVGALNDGQE